MFKDITDKNQLIMFGELATYTYMGNIYTKTVTGKLMYITPDRIVLCLEDECYEWLYLDEIISVDKKPEEEKDEIIPLEPGES